MNREQQEMALWRGVFEHWYRRELYEIDTCGNIADAAVAEFRKRYPPQPAAPPAVWYDEPPFDCGGTSYPCWAQGLAYPVRVAYVCGQWQWTHGSDGWRPLASRRVSPIIKPQEPNQ